MSGIEYNGYSIEMLEDFYVRYLEEKMHVDFFFDPGGGEENAMVLFTKNPRSSEKLSSADVVRALDRIVAHFESVGYKVFINGG